MRSDGILKSQCDLCSPTVSGVYSNTISLFFPERIVPFCSKKCHNSIVKKCRQYKLDVEKEKKRVERNQKKIEAEKKKKELNQDMSCDGLPGLKSTEATILDFLTNKDFMSKIMGGKDRQGKTDGNPPSFYYNQIRKMVEFNTGKF